MTTLSMSFDDYLIVSPSGWMKEEHSIVECVLARYWVLVWRSFYYGLQRTRYDGCAVYGNGSRRISPL